MIIITECHYFLLNSSSMHQKKKHTVLTVCSFVCRCWTLSGRMSTYWCWALRTQWLWSEADTDQHPQQLSPFLSMTSMKGPFCLKAIMKSLSEKGRSQDVLLPQSEVMTPTLIQSGKVLFHSFKLELKFKLKLPKNFNYLSQYKLCLYINSCPATFSSCPFHS